MRTTVDLPENLHRITVGLARHSGRSLSQTIVDLVERGLASPSRVCVDGSPGATWKIHPLTGLPVACSPRIVSPKDVAELDDEV
ncbi:MAG: hypothetical protein RLZ83_890 [Pseudomonadota bacterium]|jgi:hypothetical protein